MSNETSIVRTHVLRRKDKDARTGWYYFKVLELKCGAILEENSKGVVIREISVGELQNFQEQSQYDSF